MFPREKFDLDEAFKVTATPTAAPIPLTSIGTIRVVVLDAGGIDDGGTNKITVNVGGKAVVFAAADLDKNGVGWIQDKLGGPEKVAEIEAALQAQIDEQRAPSKATGLPWQ